MVTYCFVGSMEAVLLLDVCSLSGTGQGISFNPLSKSGKHNNSFLILHNNLIIQDAFDSRRDIELKPKLHATTHPLVSHMSFTP